MFPISYVYIQTNNEPTEGVLPRFRSADTFSLEEIRSVSGRIADGNQHSRRRTCRRRGSVYESRKEGTDVTLYEMRPSAFTPAHKTACLAELVCSNSMKSKELANAHGLLKEELSILDSLVIRVAHVTAIPGGKALLTGRNSRDGLPMQSRTMPVLRIVRKDKRYSFRDSCYRDGAPYK